MMWTHASLLLGSTMIFLAGTTAFPTAQPLHHNNEWTLKLEIRPGRDLQSVCSQLIPQVQDLLESIYNHPFSCSCDSLDVTCESVGEICCEEECGTIAWEGDFVISGNMATSTRQVSCATITKGGGALNGESICVEYRFDGTTVTGCDVSVSGTDCNSCEYCGQLPGASEGAAYSSVDCLNIVPGGENVTTGDCGDPETIQEYENAILQCDLDSQAFAAAPTWILVSVSTLVAMATAYLIEKY